MVDETNTRQTGLLAFPVEPVPDLDDELVAHILIEMLIRERRSASAAPVLPETEAVLRRLLLIPEPMIIDVVAVDTVRGRDQPPRRFAR